MSLRPASSALAPWAGLFLGALGWFVHQQGGSNADYWDCRIGGPLWAVLLSIPCVAAAAIGGYVSWAAARAAQGEGSATRRFAGAVGAATAAIFLMAIGFQVLGSLIVPACAR